jgi:hypothetical protein
MKGSINQKKKKTSMEGITNRLKQKEEGISGMKIRFSKYYTHIAIKGKKQLG